MSLLQRGSDFVGFGQPDGDSLKWIWENLVVPLNSNGGKKDLLTPFLKTLTCGASDLNALELDNESEAAREDMLSIFAMYWGKVDNDF